jgi:hypothetical protein
MDTIDKEADYPIEISKNFFEKHIESCVPFEEATPGNSYTLFYQFDLTDRLVYCMKPVLCWEQAPEFIRVGTDDSKWFVAKNGLSLGKDFYGIRHYLKTRS